MEDRKDTLYARWLSGELTDKEKRLMEDSRDIETLNAIRKAVDDFTLPAYEAEKRFAILKERTSGIEKKTRTLRPGWWIGIAASMAILVIAGTYIFRATEIVSAEFGSNAEYALPDKSIILLNDGSEIRFNRRKYGNNRKIKLKGEAFFDVVKGSPFVVTTDNGQIAVLGTSFNIRSWGSNLYVECYNGSVGVRHENILKVLNAGQSVSVVNGEMEEMTILEHVRPQWEKGISRFYSENINEIFRELERQYNVKVHIPNIERKFSGVFSHDDLEAALNDICQPMQLEYQLDEKTRTIEIAEIE